MNGTVQRLTNVLLGPTDNSAPPRIVNLGIYCLIAVAHGLTALPFLLNRDPGTDMALWSFPLDDFYIHLDYARELAESGVFGYNQGIWEAGATSPLWVIVLAVLYRVFVMNGVHVAIVAKAASFVFAVGTSIVIFHLGRRVASGTIIPLLAALVIALEPTFSYHKVSGMEGTLFAFLAGTSALFLLQNRSWCLGISLGLVAWSRPEGYVFICVVCFVVMVDVVQDGLGRGGLDAIRWNRLIQVLLPVALMAGIWVIYNHAINGSVYPNTYLVKRDSTLGWFNLDNILDLWSRYSNQVGTFASPAGITAALVFFMAGTVFVISRLGLYGLPLVVFPWTVWYAVSISLRMNVGWSFWERRYVDPALPYFIFVAILGVAFVVAICASQFRRRKLVARGLVQLLLLAGLLFLLQVTGFPYRRVIYQWAEYPRQYAWNCDNIEEVDGVGGRWLKDNLPPGATVATFDAGAARYFGKHYTIDVVGLNFHQAIRRPYSDVVREFKPDYVFIFSRFYSSIEKDVPNAKVLLTLKPKQNTILGGDEAVLAQIDWN